MKVHFNYFCSIRYSTFNIKIITKSHRTIVCYSIDENVGHVENIHLYSTETIIFLCGYTAILNVLNLFFAHFLCVHFLYMTIKSI